MRYWPATLTVLAASGLAAPAAAQSVSDVYVAVGYSDEVILLVQTKGDLDREPRTTHVSQFAYYPTPSFNFEGVPIRLTETEFEIDCERGASRRLHASTYRDIGDRVGGESYSEEWGPIEPGDQMATMRRLACKGLGREDAFYTNIRAAVTGLSGLLGEARAQ